MRGSAVCQLLKEGGSVWRRPGWTVALVALWILALGSLFLPGCNSGLVGGERGLLDGRRPIEVEGVSRPAVLNDGVQAVDGDFWKSELTAVFRTPSAYVEYDLGEPTAIRAAFVQGDNNDTYTVLGSLDGKSFTLIWEAGPAPGRGVQPRATESLNANARYVRIGARGGDRSYALSEVALYSEVPSSFPPKLIKRRGLPQPEAVRSKVLLFALAMGAWLFLTWRGAPLGWKLGTLIIPVIAGAALYQVLRVGWPVEGREVALVRGVTAGIAAMAILREVLLPKRYPASRLSVVTTLGVAGIGAFLAFFNLLHPQFHDAKHDQPLFVHNFDMRVYYPVAKYFSELRFDGLYMASVAAMVDDVEPLTLDTPPIPRTELRNLKTHRMQRVEEVKDQIAAIPQRFTPERWEAFKTDMRYFRETMGQRDYLGSMRDHGGNATPVWLAIAHLIFAGTTASNETLTVTGLLDPLLLLIAFGAIWRTFGIRTMLVAMAVWGANDFYMFGSNWGGATLRHDWMAYLALGVCALKQRWWMAGGALLALSALIRAFPALALIGLTFPAVWYVIDYRRAHGQLPTVRALIQGNRPLLSATLGATICVVAFVMLSSALFSPDAWVEWFNKVRLLDRDPHVNHISLRALVAGSGHLQHSILRARWPLFVTLIVFYSGASFWLSRGKRLDEAAVLGAMLIPVAFNPANYYIHYIFVIPMLASEARRRDGKGPSLTTYDAAMWGSLLAICMAQYWTTFVKDTELHFQFATVLYFAGITLVLLFLVLRDWETIGVAGTPLSLLVPSPPDQNGGADEGDRVETAERAEPDDDDDSNDDDSDDDDGDDDDSDDDDSDDDDGDDDDSDDDDSGGRKDSDVHQPDELGDRAGESREELDDDSDDAPDKD